MRPVPIPKAVSELSWVADTTVLSAPGGDLTHPTVAPVEAMRIVLPDGRYAMGVLVMLEDDDLEAIRAGARHVVMAWPGNSVPVFMEPWMMEVES